MKRTSANGSANENSIRPPSTIYTLCVLKIRSIESLCGNSKRQKHIDKAAKRKIEETMCTPAFLHTIQYTTMGVWVFEYFFPFFLGKNLTKMKNGTRNNNKNALRNKLNAIKNYLPVAQHAASAIANKEKRNTLHRHQRVAK